MAAPESLTDTELTDLLRSGDRASFAELYSRYWKKMLQIAWNHMRDKVQAEDIVHEVFLSLQEKREDVRILNVPGYLATSIKFSIFKHYQRGARREQLVLANYDYSEESDDEAQLDALFLKEYLDGLIEQLPEKCRLTFLYSREEGLSNAEIAARMGISEKGVEANLTRALKSIRGNLKDSGLLLLLSEQLWKHLF